MASPSNPVDVSLGLSLKLWIDPKHPKVLYAEAGKDFVDFLLSLLSLPVSTVISTLTRGEMVGSLGKVFGSFQKLDNKYMQPKLNKDILLKPKVSVAGPDILKLTNNVEPSARKALYLCSYHSYSAQVHKYVTENPIEKCPSCSSTMNLPAAYVDQATTTAETSVAGATGYVNDAGRYMIMDDLEVKAPLSTDLINTVLKNSKIELAALQSKDVRLTKDKGVKLLKESLKSKSVLTKVFHGELPLVEQPSSVRTDSDSECCCFC